MTAKLTVTNLTKNFGDKQVLKGVDFVVNKGESVVILGGSGSGKSVLIKTIASLIEATSGSIKIDDVEVARLNDKERDKLMEKFGFLFQGGALFDSLPIWENVAFRLLNHKKISKKEAREIAISKLKDVGLSEKVADLYPSELSGGMQKRASLARAVASNPEIIFFDEPTTGLDPIMADVINDLIISNSKQLGATTITITHDMNSAAESTLLRFSTWLRFCLCDNAFPNAPEHDIRVPCPPASPCEIRTEKRRHLRRKKS